MTRIAALILTAILAVSLAACEDEPTDARKKTQQAEQNFQGEIGAKKAKVVGYPKVEKFAESANLKRYYEAVDDPKRIGYIYLLSFGKIVAEHTVRGKVSSLNSSFTNPDQVTKADYGEGWESNVIAQAEPDGSYGDYPDGIFFWTTDGVLIEWSGDYQYSTQRQEIQQPSENILLKEVR